MPVPLRRFSQNWLANDELAIALVGAIAPREGDHFLEIGPGEGRLTRAILAHPVRVTAIEVDRRCCEALRELSAGLGDGPAGLEVVEASVLDFDPKQLHEAQLRFVGNLPYAIASPILRWTALHHGLVVDVHYMVPADVAERMLAQPGSSARGVISVMIDWFFEGSIVRRLGPGAFRPEPKIDSAFVRLRPHDPPACDSSAAHRRAVVGAAFAHRLKTLANSLRKVGWERPAIESALAAATVPEKARAEELAVGQFARLIETLPELSP